MRGTWVTKYRRWATLGLLSSLATLGIGVLAWRWHHFHVLFREYQAAAGRAGKLEQHLLSRARSCEEDVSTNEHELNKYESSKDVDLGSPMYQLWKDKTKEANSLFRDMAIHYRESARTLHAIKLMRYRQARQMERRW